MKSKVGTIIIMLFLLIGIAGMIYFNYTLFKPSSDMEEILLDDEETTPQVTGSETISEPNETPSAVRQAMVLYENDFSDATSLADFQVTDTGDKEKPSSWAIKNGELVQSSNIWGGTYGKPIAGKQFLGTSLTLKDKNFNNFDFQVALRGADDDGMGIIFRSDGNNFYRVLAVKDTKNGGPFLMLDKQLLKNQKASLVALKTKEWEFETNKTYLFKVQANGDKIKVWVNDTLMFDTVDASISAGSLGMYSYGMAGLYVDTLKVTEVNGLAGESSSSATTASNIIPRTEEDEVLEANTHLEKIQGIIQSKTGMVMLVKNDATSKNQAVQIIDTTDLRKNSSTGVKAELSELVAGKAIEVSGGLYQTKLSEESLFIAERIVIKSS